MSCITTETVMKASNFVLNQIAQCDCSQCAHEAFLEQMRRRMAMDRGIPYAILFGTKEPKADEAKIPRGQGQYVNANPKVRSSHDLSFLIRDKAGESTPLVVKDIDSKTLHDILDRAGEIVISRVDAQ